MRISDWSANVCSSDLGDHRQPRWRRHGGVAGAGPVGGPARGVHQLDQRQVALGAQIDQIADLEALDEHRRGAAAIAEATQQREQRRLVRQADRGRSEGHTSELQSLMRSSDAVFCLKQKTSKHYKSRLAYTNNAKTP